ncbi:MAG TPA: ATP-binding protein, partial [Candidatus Obscuribacterales bacterium]
MTSVYPGVIAGEVFLGGGEMGALMRSHDWSQTPLGSVEHWSPSLKVAINICLNSRFPMVIWWGDELTLIYNDAWRPILGNKHPQALGKPGQEVWGEIWDIVGTQLRSVLMTGQATWSDDQLLLVNRYGYTEEAYFTYSYSPIFLETGEVGGAFTAVAETTQRVLGERRLATLRNLAAQTGQSQTVEQACQLAIQTLSQNLADIPLACIYLLDSEGTQAVLQEQTLAKIQPLAVPLTVDLTQLNHPSTQSFTAVMQNGEAFVSEDLMQGWGEFSIGPLQLPVRQAVVLPIRASTQDSIVGMLVIGANPYQPLDEDHHNFLEMTSGHIANAIASARAYEEERQRAEALTELDRAKTTFFSNISHEFRTPLTLMLSPLEEILAAEGVMPDEQRQQLELVHRNSLRLLKLVNTLLDFSRIEAGRVQAVYEATDLAALTAELASVFRSAIEQAGLQFCVACESLAGPVYVDREMWEKIIFNLLSNALKFTFAGEIAVTLRQQQSQVELTVRDTGIGIAATELPRLFERFYRVEGAQGRSQEGSGIGLALVKELVHLHGGEVQVASIEGEGTTFTLTIPTGTEHLPPERLQLSDRAISVRAAERPEATPPLAPTALGAAPYVEEALRWLPEVRQGAWDIENQKSTAPSPFPSSLLPTSLSTARILLVDDNTDMRDYVRRLLLNQGYDVETAADGVTALSVIQQQLPDLVLTDVMMPRLDGFGLLRELRAAPTTKDIPIILLSARAGEEARVEGLEAGADDYLIKPFSARELLARVEASLKLAYLRRETQQREQTLRLDAEAAQQSVETILSSINDGFYRLDRNWCYTYINDRNCEIVGMPRSDVLGKNIWELFPDLVDTELYANFQQSLTAQTPVQFEYFYPAWNRWFENRIYPSPTGLTVFVADISDRKKAEEALRHANERFEYATAAVDCLIYDWDIEQDRVERTAGLTRILGYTFEETEPTGAWWRERLHPEDLQRMQAETVASLTTSDRCTVEYRVLNKANQYVYVVDHGIVVARDAQGNPTRVIGSTVDINKRKQTEAERDHLLTRERAAREEAETANRVKDEFLAVLSHELRSPLNPILGWSKLLQTRQFDPPATQRALQTIERNAKLQTQLIEDLLDVSRILQGKMALNVGLVNLVTVIESALETVRLAAEAKQIQLQIVMSLEHPQVSGDPARLQQIVWNLLSNAIKFTPDGGQVEICLDQIGTYAQIQVKDTGKGISPDFLPYVFDYFRQEDGKTTRKFGGLGLGLAIVRHLSELHGGTVQVESPGEDQGATFIVRLPLTTKLADLEAEHCTTAESVDLSQLSILIVDDDEDMRSLVQVILEQQGAQVEVATSAAEVLLLLDRQLPNVLISDIGMPDMDGYMLM